MIDVSSNHWHKIAATSIGDGVALACQSASRSGVVVGNFASGFYVRTDENLIAVGGPDIPAGPIHLILDSLPPLCADDSEVELTSDQLRFNSFSITLGQASRHQPFQPTPNLLLSIAPILAQLDGWYPVADDLESIWPRVKGTIESANLRAAGELLAGLGSGLTPTGDDVLAGLLLFTYWTDPHSHLPDDVAEQAETSDLSRCFLKWSARGQSIQPVHDLIDAAAEIPATPDISSSDLVANRQFMRSIAAVASMGSSSGKGLLAGLGLAARSWSNRQ